MKHDWSHCPRARCFLATIIFVCAPLAVAYLHSGWYLSDLYYYREDGGWVGILNVSGSTGITYHVLDKHTSEDIKKYSMNRTVGWKAEICSNKEIPIEATPSFCLSDDGLSHFFAKFGFNITIDTVGGYYECILPYWLLTPLLVLFGLLVFSRLFWKCKLRPPVKL